MKALLIAAGTLELSHWVRETLEGVDWVVAIDGGLVGAFELGLMPHLLLGDLDSVSSLSLAQAEEKGIPLRLFPSQKDCTDTELAFLEAIRRGATEIVLLGALGGDRIDHLIANIFLLKQFRTLPWKIVDGNKNLFLLDHGHQRELSGEKGDLLSLIPLEGDAEGLEGEGLFYPVNNLTLRSGSAQGMSNIFLGDRVTIALKAGTVLVIHTHTRSI